MLRLFKYSLCIIISGYVPAVNAFLQPFHQMFDSTYKLQGKQLLGILPNKFQMAFHLRTLQTSNELLSTLINNNQNTLERKISDLEAKSQQLTNSISILTSSVNNQPCRVANVCAANTLCSISSSGTAVCTCLPNFFVATAGDEFGSKPGCVDPCVTMACNTQNTYCIRNSATSRICACLPSYAAINGNAATSGCQKDCVAPFKEVLTSAGSPCYFLSPVPVNFIAARAACPALSATSILAEPALNLAAIEDLTKKLEITCTAEIAQIRALTGSNKQDIYLGVLDATDAGPLNHLVGSGSVAYADPVVVGTDNAVSEAGTLVIEVIAERYKLRARDNPNALSLPYLCQIARPT